MQRASAFCNRILTVAAVSLLLAAVPAHATSKEIIQMQAQVQQLLDNAQRLQSTMDKGFAVLQNLAQQTADNATQMNAAVNALQKAIAVENEATNGKLDANAGQIQSLNDSVDELKSRIAKLDKSIQDMQSQLQNIQNPPQAPAATGTAPANGSPVPAPVAAGTEVNPTPPLKETLQAGVRDYNAAKYEVAAGEFQDVIHYYPLDEMAGTAQFYLGEIAYRQKNFEDAVKAYNAVLEGFPGNAKAPAAQLRKGLALLQMNKKQAGITELRLLIRRHPQTPEAAQARIKLREVGARTSSAR